METHAGKKTNRRSRRGLNRTMQYGNENNRQVSIQADFCLNRTMQYGNFPKKHSRRERDNV